jgi:trimeric autotransporter adhesin
MIRHRGVALTIMAAAIFAVACGSDDEPLTGTAAVVGITVSQPTGNVFVGATTTLTATAKDAGGAAVSGATVTWSSSSDAIATVSQAGVVTGVAPGTATITATSNGKTGTASVTIVSKIVTFKATMASSNEVPVNSSTGTGSFTATLDTTTNLFTYDITFSGLTSNVTLGHIHGPAAVGVNTGTTINFGTLAGATFSLGATSGTAHGSVTLTAATAITAAMNGDSLKKLLFAGLTYSNIHTTNNGGGEIRGQITKQ